jgi:hypothetical protein
MRTAILIIAIAFIAQAQAFTYFEDHFDSPALDSAWNVIGTGTYTTGNGQLNFITRSGDWVDAYGKLPEHVFTVTPPAQYQQWSAVTRVRYNTPDQRYEQVAVFAYESDDEYVKLSYNRGDAQVQYSLLSENGGYHQESFLAPTNTDFFWIRIDRDGDEYTTFSSSDLTTDPDAVTWTKLGDWTNALAGPSAGIGGWNGGNQPDGELAEFDYFRLDIVPEPASLGLLLALGLCLRRRGA